MNADSVAHSPVTPKERAEHVLDWWTIADEPLPLSEALARAFQDAEADALDRAVAAILEIRPEASSLFGTLVGGITRMDAVRAVLALKPRTKGKP